MNEAETAVNRVLDALRAYPDQPLNMDEVADLIEHLAADPPRPRLAERLLLARAERRTRRRKPAGPLTRCPHCGRDLSRPGALETHLTAIHLAVHMIVQDADWLRHELAQERNGLRRG